MGKIIPFPSKTNDIVSMLEEILEMAREGTYQSFAFAAVFAEDGKTVHTAYYDEDLAERQMLASNIQIDIMNEVVRVNYIEE